MRHPQESATPFEKLDRAMNKAIGLGVYRFFLMVFVIMQLWLASNYVKRDDFEKMKDVLHGIEKTLDRITAQDYKLQDHEARIRELEKQHR